MSINISNLQVDSRDYISILEDLLATIPELTEKWTPGDDNDPGVVLVKLMAMYGDMLSYNHDKAVLEVYPSTVTQRKNAANVFGLIGYKMRWYQSARCKATLTNSGFQTASMPRYTTFQTIDAQTNYTYVGKHNESWLNLDSINDYPGTTYDVELVQGTPVTPSLVNDYVIPFQQNTEWHTAYNNNISKQDIVDGNRIYLWNTNVDEFSVTLVGNNNEWTQVENIDALTTTGNYYEFKVDSDDRPYLQLVNYWKDYNPSGNFKVFYILSSGKNGEIATNTLGKATSQIVVYNPNTGTQTDVSDSILISNHTSTFGYDPETPEEARHESAKYINTHDTLITLEDFERATKRLYGVANCYCTDRTNDVHGTEMSATDLNIYIAETDDYKEAVDDTTYASYIQTALNANKMIPLNLNVITDGITFYDWAIEGKIYTKELVSTDRAQDIIVKLNDKLRETYALENVEFNSVVNYVDIVDIILAIDPLIKNVYLHPIVYTTNIDEYDDYGDNIVPTVVDEETITGSYSLYSVFPNYPTRCIKTLHVSDTNTIVDSKHVTLPSVYWEKDGRVMEMTVGTSKNNGVSVVSLVNEFYGKSDYLIKNGKPRVLLASEVTADISIHAYYRSGIFYTDTEYDTEIIPQEGKYYLNLRSYSSTSEDYTDVYLYSGGEYKLQSDPGVRFADVTMLITDANENPLEIETPIRPGNFIVKIDNSRHIIYDNRNGEFASESGIFNEGAIDYATGDLVIETVSDVTNLTIPYVRNAINLAKFKNIDVNKFFVAHECIKS